MRLPELMGPEAIAGAMRKPIATVAVVAALAVGVALETPASVAAQPKAPDAPAAASPREQGNHDSELVPSLAVGGFMIAACAGGVYSISRAMREM